mgnify:CR=1 FL=1|jgi:hypothetical protein
MNLLKRHGGGCINRSDILPALGIFSLWKRDIFINKSNLFPAAGLLQFGKISQLVEMLYRALKDYLL